jgi:hypothetical protein
MACRLIATGSGGFVIACGPRTPPARCSVPGCTGHAGKLCDYPVTRKGAPATCDAKLCDRHAAPGGDGADHCPPHAARARALKEEAGRGG